MAQVTITYAGWRCDRCDHQWVPRSVYTIPRVCPKCKSPYWNIERKVGKVKPEHDR